MIEYLIEKLQISKSKLFLNNMKLHILEDKKNRNKIKSIKEILEQLTLVEGIVSANKINSRKEQIFVSLKDLCNYIKTNPLPTTHKVVEKDNLFSCVFGLNELVMRDADDHKIREEIFRIKAIYKNNVLTGLYKEEVKDIEVLRDKINLFPDNSVDDDVKKNNENDKLNNFLNKYIDFLLNDIMDLLLQFDNEKIKKDIDVECEHILKEIEEKDDEVVKLKYIEINSFYMFLVFREMKDFDSKNKSAFWNLFKDYLNKKKYIKYFPQINEKKKRTRKSGKIDLVVLLKIKKKIEKNEKLSFKSALENLEFDSMGIDLAYKWVSNNKKYYEKIEGWKPKKFFRELSESEIEEWYQNYKGDNIPQKRWTR